MKILVCDDEPKRCEQISAAIREAGLPEPDKLVDTEQSKKFSDELKKLFANVDNCIKNPTTCKSVEMPKFDDAEIVILDNNLAHLDVAGARLTAESIAGYIRAFTKARYVISVNKNPDVDFDLRYLVGDYSTKADLTLNDKHLANRALWSGKPEDANDGFLPWYWPNLSTVAQRRSKQIEFVRNHLNVPVVEAMEFPAEALSFLSLHAKGALCPDEDIPFEKVRFRDVFVSRDRSLPSKKEREAILEAGTQRNAALLDIIARIVAADIDLWFRRDVLGPQESLVDIPHLLSRFPFLLGNRAKDINEWNKCVGVDTVPYGLDKKLYNDHLAGQEFKHRFWVPTSCFWWPKLKSDEKLNSYLFEAKESEWADVVFCEDRSVFVERAPKNGEQAPFIFAAEFEGSWRERYISRIQGIHYAPRSRLAL